MGTLVSFSNLQCFTSCFCNIPYILNSTHNCIAFTQLASQLHCMTYVHLISTVWVCESTSTLQCKYNLVSILKVVRCKAKKLQSAHHKNTHGLYCMLLMCTAKLCNLGQIDNHSRGICGCQHEPQSILEHYYHSFLQSCKVGD